MNRSIATCFGCGRTCDHCQFCKEVYCYECDDHNEDRCARDQYEYEREELLRDFDDRWRGGR